MNKSIKYLIVTAFAVSATSLCAHSAHTYLSRRPHNVNLPMELTSFYERTQLKLENRFGGNLQIAGFYGETNKNIGEYFSCPGGCEESCNSCNSCDTKPTCNTCNTGCNTCDTGCDSCCKGGYTLQRYDVNSCPTDVQDFDLGYILHDYDDSYEELEPNKTVVAYDPSQKSWGFRFDYYQNMDKILKGLYLKANMTFVDVKNCMNLCVSSEDADTKTALVNFFKGSYSVTEEDGPDMQSALCKGLIGGSCGCGDCHSASGIADIDIILGYKFLYKEKYHFGINLGITIPTGNDADGKYMFEPIYGNGGHFGFGGGLDAHANLWTKGEQDVKFNFMLNYRYLFEASECRPLKLKCVCSPYVLLGTIGADAGTPLVPAVNVLSNGVDVTPGSQLDAIFALAYNNGGLTFDLGYNLYYREEEDVDLKCNSCCSSDVQYAIAARNFDTRIAFGDDATSANLNIDQCIGPKKAISKCDIDTDAAATPSQCTNGIYGGLGYHFKKWDYPLLMGIGGKYDWASSNSEFDSWSIWAKLAVSF
jgi:hypothetical protein